jgi:flagellar biosynthesis protein FlhF
MKVKKFQAPSLNEAMRMVKAEFGNDAVILSTKKIKRSDSYGIFSRDWIEVEAAIDYKENSYTPTFKKRNSITTDTKDSSDFKDEITVFKNLLTEHLKDTELLKKEVPQLKKMLSLLMKQSGIYQGDSLDNKFISLYEDLIMQEVSEDIAYKLIENLNFELGEETNISLERLRNILMIKMRNKIKIFNPVQNSNKPNIIAFVGPTGVGKTTTLAKIAAQYMLLQKKKVALFTLDTYRIAAVEQLKIYGEILKTPVIVINKRNDFLDKLNTFKDYDYVLIDTAGRSQRDSFHIKKLKEFLKLPVEIHLVLSATTKNKDLDDIISRFSIIPFSALLFTKLDESSTLGNIFNKGFETGKPLSYFTTGQRVPEDIEVASKDKLIKALLEYN